MNEHKTDFQFLTENSVDVVCQAEMDATMRYVSPSSTRVLGWAPEEMIGRNIAEFLLPEHLPTFAVAVAHAKTPGVEQKSVTLQLRRRDGSACWLEMNARFVCDQETGQAVSAVVIMRDVNVRKHLEEQLAMLAHTDGLTGLANRRAFDAALETEWSRTIRERSQMSLLLLDIDHFKTFNDGYGHQMGDDCLRAVATAAREAVRRATDLVARYGGEEIAVVLPGTDAASAGVVAEAARQAVMNLRIPHVANVQGGGLVTVSVGAATAMARDGASLKMPASLLMLADSALYRSKSAGRNRVSTSLLLAATG